MSNVLSCDTLDLVFYDWRLDKSQGKAAGIRFGQYIYNKYNFECGNSYDENDWGRVFDLIYNSLREGNHCIFTTEP